MKERKPLLLYEELMLLALRDEKGTTASGAMYPQAIGGAILAELLLAGHIDIEEKRKRKFARVIDHSKTGDALLDECLEKIRTAKRRGSLKAWVMRFANTKKLKHRVALQLVHKGVLRAEEDKVLLVFTRKIYPELDPRPERELTERLRKAIFTDTRSVDTRTVVLLSLARGTNLLRNNFDRKALKERKDRIKRLVNGEVTGKATREAIQAMHAAAMVTVMITTT